MSAPVVTAAGLEDLLAGIPVDLSVAQVRHRTIKGFKELVRACLPDDGDECKECALLTIVGDGLACRDHEAQAIVLRQFAETLVALGGAQALREALS